MSIEPLVRVNNITQSFMSGGETINVIKHADLEIHPSTFNIIYGPSGSGKSTLLNILSGLQKPTTGEVLFQGRNIYELTSDELAFFRANRIGIAYQTNYWVKSLNVLENVAMPLFFLGYPKAKAEKLAKMSLDRVHMGGYYKKDPSLLSGGEQQRIAMARALANTPMFIIADEPTGNLDTENGELIIDLLRNCQTEFRATVILVTHNLEYLPLADNLFRMSDGELLQSSGNDATAATNDLLNELKERIAQRKSSKQKGTR